MKNIAVTILGLILALTISCNDNPSEVENSDFNFEVNVNSSNSAQISNLKVSEWNKIIPSNRSIPKLNNIGEIQATTSIEFLLRQNCYVNLKLYDLENEVFEKIINSKFMNAGTYKQQFYNNDRTGTTVFKCKLEIFEDSTFTTPIFLDSIYTVIMAPDPEIAQVGVTNENGQLVLKKKILFPNLYDLPEFILTSEASPRQIGTFSISEEIIIALTNNDNETKYYEKVISEGGNIFNLNWEEGSLDYPDWGLGGSINNSNSFYKVADDSTIGTPMNFELSQNYPNPFN